MVNAILAAILSIILPGLGQFYGKQGITKSVIFLIAGIIIYVLYYMVSVNLGILFLFNIYAAYDASKNI